MPPVSDPENWNWTTFSFAPMLGFAMHNTGYRVTVQWRYGVYMKGPRGPFQTSITVNVQNLVVTSGDVGKVLKWDPEMGISDTSFSYNLECAQRKHCQVKVSIYSLDGGKVYEVTEQKMCPGSYSFTWDGTINVWEGYGYPPDEENNIAPAGLYTFDVQVMATPYERDTIRSEMLRVEPGPVEYYGYDDGGTPEDESDDKYLYYIRWYALYSGRDATWGEIWLYDPDFDRVGSWAVVGLTCVMHLENDGLRANPEGEVHGVIVPVPVSAMEKAGTYWFVLHFYDDYADMYKDHEVKAALEMNQVHAWFPLVYISGTYAGTTWHGAWCWWLRCYRSTRHLNPADEVRNIVRSITPLGTGTVAAGVNGGFFDPRTGDLVGHVGVGTWIGTDISRHRWAYGDNGGRGPGWHIERMAQVEGTNTFTIPTRIRSFPFGLTGIGCLIRNGIPEPFANQDWHVPRNWRDAWTLVAWDIENRHFFLIVCERNGARDDTGYSQGWTWDDAVNFLMVVLPPYMARHWLVRVRIDGAMMLDGGGSTQFFYRCAPQIGWFWEAPSYSATGRMVPTMVQAIFDHISRCPLSPLRHLHP